MVNTHKLTAVLHTRNRPEFAARALRYYAVRFQGPIIVLDASDDTNFADLRAAIASIKPRGPLELVHHPEDTAFLQRMHDAVQAIKTPYVLLMADDDFYFEPWFEAGVAHLEANTSCMVLYGHALRFEIDRGYVATGNAEKFGYCDFDPVARWMDQPSVTERLTELGRGPFTTTGWYATQRRELLWNVISKTREARFDLLLSPDAPAGELDMFERLLTLLQPIYGRVKMLDTVFLARQMDVGAYRRPASWKASRRAMARLVDIAVQVTRDTSPLGEHEARALIERTLQHEIAQMKANDRREALRIESIKSKAPWATRLVRDVKKLRNRLLDLEPLALEPRFPQRPPLANLAAEIAIVKESCRPLLK